MEKEDSYLQHQSLELANSALTQGVEKNLRCQYQRMEMRFEMERVHHLKMVCTGFNLVIFRLLSDV